jgi:hypothetical protein
MRRDMAAAAEKSAIEKPAWGNGCFLALKRRGYSG